MMLKSPTWILPGEIGQLVDGENAAIGARQQSVVNGQLIAQQVSALRGLDRIDVADDVSDGYVRRCQFLYKA